MTTACKGAENKFPAFYFIYHHALILLLPTSLEIFCLVTNVLSHAMIVTSVFSQMNC